MDTGAHYYNVYKTSDGQFISVGAMEPRFTRSFMKGLGFSDEDIPPQDDRTQWDALKRQVAEIFLSRTTASPNVLETFRGTDACVTPVLSLGDAPTHAHNRARATFVEVGGVVEPAPTGPGSAAPLPQLRPHHPARVCMPPRLSCTGGCRSPTSTS